VALYLVQPGSAVNAADPNQFTNLLNGTTSGVQITNSGRIRAQLTGATSGAGGYVGQVAGAAPASGTFVVGDYAIDGTLGTEWVCTTAGTPGTWGALPTQIATQTLGSNSASVTFSSIPAFNHISVIWKTRASDANPAEQIFLRFNGDVASHYLWELNQANNAGAVSGGTSGALVAQIQIGTIPAANATAGYFGSGQFTVAYFNDTTNFTTVQGTACAFATTTNMWSGTYSGLYNQAATITSLTLFAASGNLVSGSRFSLYGWM
jgi:hypothetical protein